MLGFIKTAGAMLSRAKSFFPLNTHSSYQEIPLPDWKRRVEANILNKLSLTLEPEELKRNLELLTSQREIMKLNEEEFKYSLERLREKAKLILESVQEDINPSYNPQIYRELALEFNQIAYNLREERIYNNRIYNILTQTQFAS